MNIIEALTLLKKNQNKTIRRKKTTYTYKMDRGVIYTPFNNEEVWFFSVHDILAEDWEVVDEQIEIKHRSQRLLPDVDNHLNKEYVDKMTDIINKIEVKKDELFKPLETKKYNPYIDTRTKEQKITHK